MIVDSHVHAWQNPADAGLTLDDRGAPSRPPAADVSDYMEAAQVAGLSLVWGFASQRLGAEVRTEFLGRHVGMNQSHSVGIIGIDPTDPAWRDTLDEAVGEWGFRGVTICPPAQDLHPCDTRALALYDRCVDLSLPVMIDLPPQWRPDATLAFARPDLLDNVARDFPDLRILIAGFAWPYVDQVLVLLEKFPTVFTDTGHLGSRPLALSHALARAAEAGCLEKVFFGSGFPFAWPRNVVARLYDQCSVQRTPRELLLPRDAVDALLRRDILSALRIPRPEGLAESADAAEEDEDDEDTPEDRSVEDD